MTDVNAMTDGPIDAGNTAATVYQLNSLLRGEISAAETYRMVIDKVVSSNQTADRVELLREIQEEHSRAAQALRNRIQELGGKASDSSGVWGAWAKTIQGTMNLLGEAASLKSLKENEQYDLKDYREALNKVDPGSIQLIQNQLIPSQQRHIDLLEQLIHSIGRT